MHGVMTLQIPIKHLHTPKIVGFTVPKDTRFVSVGIDRRKREDGDPDEFIIIRGIQIAKDDTEVRFFCVARDAEAISIGSMTAYDLSKAYIGTACTDRRGWNVFEVNVPVYGTDGALLSPEHLSW